MSPLPAPRRTVTKTAETKAHIPGALSALINTENDLALSSVRITEMPDGQFEVAGQVGELAGTRCPSCNGYWHTADGECIDSARPVHSTPAAGQHKTAARTAVAEARTTTATECPSCHAQYGRPHTEYCQAVPPSEYPGQPAPHQRGIDCPQPCPWHGAPDRGGDTLEPDRLITYPGGEVRPANDPPDRHTCDGRNCGGRPHA